MSQKLELSKVPTEWLLLRPFNIAGDRLLSTLEGWRFWACALTTISTAFASMVALFGAATQASWALPALSAACGLSCASAVAEHYSYRPAHAFNSLVVACFVAIVLILVV